MNRKTWILVVIIAVLVLVLAYAGFLLFQFLQSVSEM